MSGAPGPTGRAARTSGRVARTSGRVARTSSWPAARRGPSPAGPAPRSGWWRSGARRWPGPCSAWSGYHELVQPSLWTGYVPVVPATSSLAVVLVLAHGWLLLLLAVAIVAGVAHRSASAVAALLMLEIVISLTVTGGLSDLTMRDVGVLGLAICLAAGTRQRLLLSR